MPNTEFYRKRILDSYTELRDAALAYSKSDGPGNSDKSKN
jgi:hypothetical protein